MTNWNAPVDPRFAHLPPPPPSPPGGWWTTPPTGAPPPPVAPGSLAPPHGPGGPPPRSERRVALEVRNLVLTLGVASLVAAAVSFVAVNWDAFDATMRATLLVATTVASLCLGAAARIRGLAGTATALAWLTTVLAFIDLLAVQRAMHGDDTSLATFAVGGGILFLGFLLVGRWQPGAAMQTGAVTAWLLTWWAALAHHDVTGADVWLLPVAGIVGWLQWRSCVGRPGVGSWERYGVGLAFAAVPAVSTALGDPNTLRPVLLIAVVTLVLVAGLRLRQLAMVQVAGFSLAVLVGAQLVEVLRGVPGWAVFALVGLVLLAVGAGFEYRLRRNGDTSVG